MSYWHHTAGLNVVSYHQQTICNESNVEKAHLVTESRRHMKLIMSSATGLMQQDSLTSLQLSTRNAQLVILFPVTCRPQLLVVHSEVVLYVKLWCTYHAYIPVAFKSEINKLINDINSRFQGYSHTVFICI